MKKTSRIKKVLLSLALALVLTAAAAPATVQAAGGGAGGAATPAGATQDEKVAAINSIGTYANTLIKTNGLAGKAKSDILEINSAAAGYINGYSGSSATLADYCSSVRSQMDAVVASIPATTSEFLALTDIYQTPTVKAGQKVTIVLPMANYSPVALSDVIVQPKESNLVSEWPFEPSAAGNVRTVLSFPPYDNTKNINDMRQDVGFDFTVRSDVKSGFYPLKFDVLYTRNGKVETCVMTTYVKTIGAPENGTLEGVNQEGEKSKPRIIVTGFETTPAEVYAGDTFTVTIHVKNTSATTPVKNVLFNMEAVVTGTDTTNTYAAFLPTSGSSSVYVGSLGAGASTDLTMEMSAKADLAQKPYVLDVHMKYDAETSFDLTDTASVSIPILQEQRCETGAAEIMPDNITVGGQSNVVFDVYNTGRTTLYNVWVRFKGDSVSGGDTFLGTITPGSTGNCDAMVTGASATTDDGKVIAEISFENEAGKITTVEKELTIWVNEEFIDDGVYEGDWGMEGEFVEPEKPGLSTPLLIAIIAAVVIIGLIVFLVIRKKNKAKRAEAALEKELADEIEEEKKS